MRLFPVCMAVVLAVTPVFAKAPPGSDPNSPTAIWFRKQHNMDGGWCCSLADGHRLDPGDVRFNGKTGLWEVHLPDPSEVGQERLDKPRVWLEVPNYKLRHPDGGPNPIGHPIAWYNVRTENGAPYYELWCFDPDTLM
jgi:hypothetical protein